MWWLWWLWCLWSRRNVYDMSLTICHNSPAPNYGSRVPVDTAPGYPHPSCQDRQLELVAAATQRRPPMESPRSQGPWESASVPQQGIVDELDELQLRHLHGFLQSLSLAHLSFTTASMASTTCTTGALTRQAKGRVRVTRRAPQAAVAPLRPGLRKDARPLPRRRSLLCPWAVVHLVDLLLPDDCGRPLSSRGVVRRLCHSHRDSHPFALSGGGHYLCRRPHRVQHSLSTARTNTKATQNATQPV